LNQAASISPSNSSAKHQIHFGRLNPGHGRIRVGVSPFKLDVRQWAHSRVSIASGHLGGVSGEMEKLKQLQKNLEKKHGTARLQA